MPLDLETGRYFTPIESQSGRPVAIIGCEIADNLFENKDPIGKKIKVFGRNLSVIGIMKKEGEDMFGNTSDDQIIIPINFARNVLDLRNIGSTIIVRAKPFVSNDELRDDLTGVLRSVRKLKPSADDNFAINETDIISRGFDELFGVISIVGWIIGGFSLLVGGFGIANIMFVSVRERINIIGIQKSLGAKNYFILLQFLFESIFLALFGGILGLIIVFIISLIVTYGFDMELILTSGNILLGIIVSGIIGLFSGIVPAYSASKLNPVEAMRTNA
ncbi:MAG: ABC transporter permease [Bacteroidetes bacterium]|nr:ABC transporter permease [Bacteroidota bacterium]